MDGGSVGQRSGQGNRVEWNGMDPGTKLQMNGHKELITLAVVSVLVAVLKIELCFVQEEGYIFHMSIVVGD